MIIRWYDHFKRQHAYYRDKHYLGILVWTTLCGKRFTDNIWNTNDLPRCKTCERLAIKRGDVDWFSLLSK